MSLHPPMARRLFVQSPRRLYVVPRSPHVRFRGPPPRPALTSAEPVLATVAAASVAGVPPPVRAARGRYASGPSPTAAGAAVNGFSLHAASVFPPTIATASSTSPATSRDAHRGAQAVAPLGRARCPALQTPILSRDRGGRVHPFELIAQPRRRRGPPVPGSFLPGRAGGLPLRLAVDSTSTRRACARAISRTM